MNAAEALVHRTTTASGVSRTVTDPGAAKILADLLHLAARRRQAAATPGRAA